MKKRLISVILMFVILLSSVSAFSLWDSTNEVSGSFFDFITGYAISLSSCRDTDNTPDLRNTREPNINDLEQSAFTKGEVVYKKLGRVRRYYDKCVDQNYLLETYCSRNNPRISMKVYCENGCENGACIKIESPRPEIPPPTPENPCVDSDNTYLEESNTFNRQSGYIKGFASVRLTNGDINIHNDYCVTENQIQEAECRNNWYRYTGIGCSHGCKDGACICKYDSECSDSVCENGICVEKTCTDTDSGKDYYKKGEVAIKEHNEVYTDVCNENRLLESFCESNKRETQIYTCPYGCSQGACLTKEQKCSDFDNGDKYVKGEVKERINEQEIIHEDICINEKKLSEVNCNRDGVSEKIAIFCDYGCKDGACQRYTGLVEKGCNTNTQYPVGDTICHGYWPTVEGANIIANSEEYACSLFEVCNPDLDYVIDDAVDCCTNYKSDDTCQFALKNSGRSSNKITGFSWRDLFRRSRRTRTTTPSLSEEDSLKKCKGLYIIDALGKSAKYMKGYFAAEFCCVGNKDICPDKNLIGTCIQPAELNSNYKSYINSYAKQLTCSGMGEDEIAKRPWKSDTNMNENPFACSASDLPAHVSLNILQTGTCVDYSVVLTTLLRKAGYSADEVYSVFGFSHMYNLVKLPGTSKYHIIDTTGNRASNIEFWDIPDPSASGYMIDDTTTQKLGSVKVIKIEVKSKLSYDYCKLMDYNEKSCSNDNGEFNCPPQSEIYGCEKDRKFDLDRCTIYLGKLGKARCDECYYKISDDWEVEGCCKYKVGRASYKKCVDFNLDDIMLW